MESKEFNPSAANVGRQGLAMSSIRRGFNRERDRRKQNCAGMAGTSRGLGTTLTEHAPELPLTHRCGQAKRFAQQSLVPAVEGSMTAIEENEAHPFGPPEKPWRRRIESGEVAGAGTPGFGRAGCPSDFNSVVFRASRELFLRHT